jgi:DNA-binding NarL/FixJ family response regulator
MKLLIVDDHEVVREGLRAVLSTEDGIDHIDEADSGRTALTRARRCPPDIVLLDFRLPDMPGDELCGALRRGFPSAILVMVTTYLSEEIVRRTLQAGANAYVTKAAGLSELRRVVREFTSGQANTASRTESEIVRRLHDVVAERSSEFRLTPQQERVLELLAAGMTYQEIGRRLFISESTVRFHVQKLKERLDARTKTELVAKAIRLSLLSPAMEESRY